MGILKKIMEQIKENWRTEKKIQELKETTEHSCEESEMESKEEKRQINMEFSGKNEHICIRYQEREFNNWRKMHGEPMRRKGGSYGRI